MIEVEPQQTMLALIKCYTDIDQIVVSQKASTDKLEYYKHEFFKKLFRHFVSAHSLSQGVRIRFSDIELESKDLSAINLLARASLEAVLLFHYIYVDGGSEESTNFRFLGWWREGLITRTKYDLPGPEADKARVDDTAEIKKIIDRLQTNKEFQSLSTERKKSFLDKGNWKWIGWKDMLARTKFSSIFKKNIYSFLSTFAHSESIGMVQVRQMEHENITGEFILRTMRMLVIVNSVFLQYYLENIGIPETSIPKNDWDFIDSWATLGVLEAEKSG